MNRWKTIVTLLAAVALAYAAFAPVANTQPTGWLSYIVQDPQGIVQFRAMGAYGTPALIGVGTAVPTQANSGLPPVNGERFLVRDNAGANEPVMTFWSANSAAWHSTLVSTLATNAPDIATSVWFAADQILFEGTTADGNELIITHDGDPAADITLTAADGSTGTFFVSELATNAPDIVNAVWGVADGITFEGGVANAVETILTAPAQTTGVASFTLPDNAAVADIYPLMFSLLATNSLQTAGSIWFDTDTIVFEGAVADGNEMVVDVEDPVAATRTWLIADYDADAAFVGSLLATNAPDTNDSAWFDTNALIFEGAAQDAFETSLVPIAPTMDNTISLGDGIDGVVMTSRASVDGYALREGVPNPWRTDFMYDANLVCNTEAYVANTAAPADTEVNKCVTHNSTFEVWNEQIHTIHAWTPAATGMSISGDAVDDEGAEFRVFGGDNDLDAGWQLISQTDTGYFEVRLTIANSSETDTVLIGFQDREAFIDPPLFATINTYCTVGVADFADDPRSVYIAEEEDNDGGPIQDTGEDFADGTAITLRVVIDIAGQCDIWVDGVETDADVMAAAIDAGDVLVPFIQFMNCAVGDCGDGTPEAGVIIHHMEVGYLN